MIGSAPSRTFRRSTKIPPSRTSSPSFLANRAKKQALPRCRALLGLAPSLPKPPRPSTPELLLELTGLDLARCRACLQGTVVVAAELPRTIPPWDSS
ncbi:MAG: hypothetical protein ACE5JD_15475 [Candidatus Methylomirabilia bacterium]